MDEGAGDSALVAVVVLDTGDLVLRHRDGASVGRHLMKGAVGLTLNELMAKMLIWGVSGTARWGGKKR